MQTSQKVIIGAVLVAVLIGTPTAYLTNMQDNVTIGNKSINYTVREIKVEKEGISTQEIRDKFRELGCVNGGCSMYSIGNESRMCNGKTCRDLTKIKKNFTRYEKWQIQ